MPVLQCEYFFNSQWASSPSLKRSACSPRLQTQASKTSCMISIWAKLQLSRSPSLPKGSQRPTSLWCTSRHCGLQHCWLVGKEQGSTERLCCATLPKVSTQSAGLAVCRCARRYKHLHFLNSFVFELYTRHLLIQKL